VRVAHTVRWGVRVYTSSVVVGPTHPICSMIYGSTGATHFDELAKILTGYEITCTRSSGIFMGILFYHCRIPIQDYRSSFSGGCRTGRLGGTAQIAANPPNCVRAVLRACETHHYLVRALRP
jgi:hypothetical protein